MVILLGIEGVPVLGGIILLMLVITTVNRVTNLLLYSGPTFRAPISDKHLSVTLRNSLTSKN